MSSKKGGAFDKTLCALVGILHKKKKNMKCNCMGLALHCFKMLFLFCGLFLRPGAYNLVLYLTAVYFYNI